MLKLKRQKNGFRFSLLGEEEKGKRGKDDNNNPGDV